MLSHRSSNKDSKLLVNGRDWSLEHIFILPRYAHSRELLSEFDQPRLVQQMASTKMVVGKLWQDHGIIQRSDVQRPSCPASDPTNIRSAGKILNVCRICDHILSQIMSRKIKIRTKYKSFLIEYSRNRRLSKTNFFLAPQIYQSACPSITIALIYRLTTLNCPILAP